MVNSILIGKTIYKLLSESEDLQKFVGDKVYPLVANDDVTFPFITYYRTDITSNGCKDGYYEDDVTFTIIVVSNKYFETLEIANIVRSIFEKKRLTENITNCIVESIDEDYREGGFIQQLYFRCKMD